MFALAFPRRVALELTIESASFFSHALDVVAFEFGVNAVANAGLEIAIA